MKLCLWCDLHLPLDRNALQYDVWRWAIEDVREKSPDCILYAGDVTCDGNEDTYDSFIEAMTALEIPFLYVPGNSDLRCAQSKHSIAKKASVCTSRIKGVWIFAVNDCDGGISEKQLAELDGADENSIVFMHHPPKEHDQVSAARLLDWRARNPQTRLFYGHLHEFAVDGAAVSLPAMDPDKSIGEAPCVVYYDTVTKELCRSRYPVSVPDGMTEYFGVSCYQPLEQIRFATEKRLKYLELRPNCVGVNRKALIACVEEWRAAGGEHLSVHLPDVGYLDGAVMFDLQYDEVLEIVSLLKADRITQHVPKVSVKTVETDPTVLEEICEALATRFDQIPHAVTVGVENMHMTAKDTADGNRRFGYIPQECLQFMKAVGERCRHKVGINFDIGHARNNAPYSKTYQIGTWLSMLGKHIVGYHLHQVTYDQGKFENHMPITRIYGSLISLASFLKCWETGRINQAPIIFEMRPQNAYRETLKEFQREIAGAKQKT